MSKVITIPIEADKAGQSVKKVLEQFGLSRKEISRLKFDGEILLNGKKVTVLQTVQPEDDLVVHFPEKLKPSKGNPLTELSILYESEDVIVINKPSGMTSHESHFHMQDNAISALEGYFLNKEESVTLHGIGRLDKETSGALLLAKNQPAGARLNAQLQDHSITKTYLALCKGSFECKEGTVNQPILKVPGQYRRVVDSNGKSAITHYRVLWEKEGISLVQFQLETGRTHQIRVHMAFLGHPLLADTMYGFKDSQLSRTALHCATIAFEEPFTQKKVTVEAPLPEDLRRVIDSLQ